MVSGIFFEQMIKLIEYKYTDVLPDNFGRGVPYNPPYITNSEIRSGATFPLRQ